MNHTEQRQELPRSWGRWMEVGTIGGLVGSVLLALVALALHTRLSDAQFAVVNPVGAVAMVLMALALPVLYVSGRRRFGRLERASFGLMATGWGATAAMLALFALGSEVAGLGFLVGWLVAMVGAFAFGVASIRRGDAALPRLGAWLLVAALPVGLPLSIAYTLTALGTVDGPWNGPLVLYALAWIVISFHLWGRGHDGSLAADVPT